MTKVSILLPVRNAQRYIDACIESVNRQRYPDYEVVAIDDRSTDSSRVRLDDWARSNKKVRVIDGSGCGLGEALALGADECTGAYIARMDADDLMHPDRLHRQLAFLERSGEFSAVTSWFRVFGQTKDVVRTARHAPRDEAARALLVENWICHPATMFRAEVFRSGRVRYRGAASQDYRLWVDFVKADLSVGVLEECLHSYRAHVAQDSIAQMQGQLSVLEAAQQQLIDRLKVDLPSSVTMKLFRPALYPKLTESEFAVLESGMLGFLPGFSVPSWRRLIWTRLARVYAEHGMAGFPRFQRLAYRLSRVEGSFASVFLPLFIVRPATFQDRFYKSFLKKN